MDQVRTPSDQTLARLDRAGRRRSRQYLSDRVLDRESVDELLRVGELLKLAKSNSSSSKSGLNLATAAKTRNAINDKKQSASYTSKPNVITSPSLSSRTSNR
jgi:hypothetical protein